VIMWMSLWGWCNLFLLVLVRGRGSLGCNAP